MSDLFRVSLFRGLKLTWPTVKSVSLADIAERVAKVNADTKDSLPMIKLAVFEGGAKKEHVKCLTGAMVDYDAGAVTIDEAADLLRLAGVQALLYTSPSSSPEAPRWRALAPYSREMGPVEHQDMTDRLNGALGGIIDDAASWEIQQRFYYGQAKFRDAKKGGGRAEKIKIIRTEGACIDLLNIAPAARPARVKAAVESDRYSLADLLDDEDDDLFDMVRTSPLGLEPDEIDEILANIPNGEDGAHYDDYVQVGMALHHEYAGSAEGFEKFCAWAEQSSKFDLKNAKGRWRSFNKGAKHPTTLRSLIQVANTNKLKDDLEFVLDDESGTDKSPYDLSDLLGEDTEALPSPPVPAVAVDLDPVDPEWLHRLHRGEEGDLKSTLPNVALIVENDPRLRGIMALNEFSQEIVLKNAPQVIRKKRESAREPVNLTGRLWKVEDHLNGDNWTDSHDAAVLRYGAIPHNQSHQNRTNDKSRRKANSQ